MNKWAEFSFPDDNKRILHTKSLPRISVILFLAGILGAAWGSVVERTLRPAKASKKLIVLSFAQLVHVEALDTKACNRRFALQCMGCLKSLSSREGYIMDEMLSTGYCWVCLFFAFLSTVWFL